MSTRSGVQYHLSHPQPRSTMESHHETAIKTLSDQIAQLTTQMRQMDDRLTQRFDLMDGRVGILEKTYESNTEPDPESPLPTPPKPRRA